MSKTKIASRSFKVSDNMFKLLTGAVHELSNTDKKFHTFRSVIERTIKCLDDHVFAPDDFHDFISEYALSGPIIVHLRMETCLNERLTALKGKLQEKCGIPVYDRTAIAYFVDLCTVRKLYCKPVDRKNSA
ncbi:MAG: hypothetical protein E6Q06_00805 [Candidatus Moraniibacteriota bacterium]|nr:MAG: hypothetical protein E6Q06_00805 [Candidatus Moranbacteria bacterium]